MKEKNSFLYYPINTELLPSKYGSISESMIGMTESQILLLFCVRIKGCPANQHYRITEVRFDPETNLPNQFFIETIVGVEFASEVSVKRLKFIPQQHLSLDEDECGFSVNDLWRLQHGGAVKGRFPTQFDQYHSHNQLGEYSPNFVGSIGDESEMDRWKEDAQKIFGDEAKAIFGHISDITIKAKYLEQHRKQLFECRVKRLNYLSKLLSELELRSVELGD